MKCPTLEIDYSKTGRWDLVFGDTIVQDKLTGDTHHATYRTYYKSSDVIKEKLSELSSEELVKIAILELKHIAWMSDHGTLSPAIILNTWISLNGKFFLEAFAPLCPEKKWTVVELQNELEQKLRT